jgi:hypothetical protein
METAQDRNIIPADYPELKRLVWSRDASRPIPAREVLSIYERNWRFIDERHLTRREAELIRDLAQVYGAGVLLKS